MMTPLFRKILILAFICLGAIRTQAQEEKDFVGDWSVIGGEVQAGRTGGPRIIETKDLNLTMKIKDGLEVEAYVKKELIDFGYLNDFNLVS